MNPCFSDVMRAFSRAAISESEVLSLVSIGRASGFRLLRQGHGQLGTGETDQVMNHHDANVIGVWRTSEGYGGGHPPDVTGTDLDVLVDKADELGWTFNDSGKAIGHFFARLADWDTEGFDWYPIGHQRQGTDYVAFHHRDGTVNPESRQAAGYIKWRLRGLNASGQQSSATVALASSVPPDKRSRFRGCLLGGAVGDALGAPVEFLSRDAILDRFGGEGISHYAPAYGRLGAITDDTQLTLFTAEGLIRTWVRGSLKGVSSPVGVTALAYLRWLRTQGEEPKHRFELLDEEPGWLFGHPDLHHRRAPGNTCLSALQQMRGLSDQADNNSKGCGGVMRVAPAGLFVAGFDFGTPIEEAFDLGKTLSSITHGHPSGSLAGGVFAAIINQLARGVTLREALPAATRILIQHDGHEETLNALESAQQLADSGVEHHRAVGQLGLGWVAEEALAISVFCCLVADDFRHGVMLAVNHDGDSDSTGSITGNLLGAALGVQSIAMEWLEPLELRHVIEEIADDLCDFPDWHISEYDTGGLTQRVWQKYPGF